LRAPIQAIECRLEHVAGPVPRVGNSAIRTGLWIQIAGNHNSSALYREHSRQVMRLVCIHYDDEISAPNVQGCKRAGAMAGKIEPTPGAES
jgi:hypothetical protein